MNIPPLEPTIIEYQERAARFYNAARIERRKKDNKLMIQRLQEIAKYTAHYSRVLLFRLIESNHDDNR